MHIVYIVSVHGPVKSIISIARHVIDAGVFRNIYTIQYTVDENIIATIKMRNNFCYSLKMVKFPILR